MIEGRNLKSVGILWAQYGPYHFARAAAFKRFAGSVHVHALELADRTTDYGWERSREIELTALCPDKIVEQLSFTEVFRAARRVFAGRRIEACLLPSYSPKQSLAALLAAKSLGIRAIMMNESHAGTARAVGVSALIKKILVKLFDAALVGGSPQRRYFESLGVPAENIFTGYDAVDNEYFARRTAEIRADAARYRSEYQLPEHYFLSLGRFVSKKNLTTLIHAYRLFLNANATSKQHLVMVGSGEDEARLRGLCAELSLPVRDKTGVPGQPTESGGDTPGVHFYGFRQIEENPVFYALADAFILPSLYEEWGLVVNEAMASSLPIVVSQTAGCAEDLLGRNVQSEPGFTGVIVHVRRSNLRHKLRRNGLVFDPSSAEELSLVLRLLSAFPEMRAAMGRSSRQIVERFSCDNFGRNALLAVRAALGPSRAPEFGGGDPKAAMSRV